MTSHEPKKSRSLWNRLGNEKSPYLLQHAGNPVDWYPWGGEAFERARREDKPVFLSIGYSACHWCHVMERESFENDDVARVVNENFVPVKVDREERPDVDEIYMAAVQLTTGHGGWPLSAFLTPDGKPFFAGTYFPPEDRHGRIGFKTLCERLSEAWRTRRADVEDSAERIADAVRGFATGEFRSTKEPLSRALVSRAVDALADAFDAVHGGFGGAPKFPPHGSLALLLHEAKASGRGDALEIALKTLEAIRRGGVHDHVGGGFHRYSTDARWLVPHFEKMLYDNAQLARAYVDAFAATGNADFRRAAEGVFCWIEREMTGEGGAFLSALDADSEGEEGKCYVWTRHEIEAVLGNESGEADLFCRAYAAEPGGNWRDEATGHVSGTNILHLPRPLAALAAETGTDAAALEDRLSRARGRLLAERRKRVPPALDDKVIVAWNALAIGALAHAGRVLGEPALVARAERAARFVLGTMRSEDGRLLHTFRDGLAKLGAYLDDHALLGCALLDLHAATGEPAWLAEARALAETLLARFADRERGGFFYVPDDHENLLARSKDPFDKALPSGNGAAADLLVRLFEATGDARFGDAARASFEWLLPLLAESPRAVESALLALARFFDDGSAAALERGSAAALARAAARGGPSPHAEARSRAGEVRVEAVADTLSVRPGAAVAVALRLVTRDGWHVQTNAPADASRVATRVSLGEGGAFRVKGVDYPPGRPHPASGEKSVFVGETEIAVRLEAAAAAAPGPAGLEIRVRFQACDERSCAAPEEIRLRLPVSIAEP